MGNLSAKLQILNWLQAHDLIKVKALEEKCEMPQASIGRALNGTQSLSEKHIPALCKELKAYGFNLKS